MRSLPCLLSFAFIFGLCAYSCGPATTSEDSDETMTTSGPVEWVTYQGEPAVGKNIVLVSGDEEYRSEEALPQLAKILSTEHGFDCTVLFAQDPAEPGIIDPNYTGNIPGLEALEDADLMILFTRFRALPDSQMQYFAEYLKAGKPVIGIRTATHAFNFKDTTNQWYQWGNSFNEEGNAWDGGFGRLVLGERWHTHHGHHKNQSTRGLIAENAADHPIVNGIADGAIWGPTDVYGVRLPLPGDAMPIIMGQVTEREGEFDENDPFYGLKESDHVVATTNSAAKNAYNPNDPMMPIAWTKSYQLPGGKMGRSFTSTIGSATDMMDEDVRRLFVNATYYLLGMDVPAKAEVDLVGTYQPSAYNFHEDAYWDEKQLKVADQVME
ncbi:MAG: ThuA domain-containing protein [Saprospiraceae bacterium]|nr:ThuA domain-containing protein [Lewinella sp.]